VALLGDNGAGKSTLIKILSGVFLPSGGEVVMDGNVVVFDSPLQARLRGISTVYQDLALVDRMSIARNFVLGAEPLRQIGPVKVFDAKSAAEVTMAALADLGIRIRDPNEMVASLSGGERQAIAIARAVHFGARVLILDEPTSALADRRVMMVQSYIERARDRGLAVLLVTHNLHHAFPVADRFVLLHAGRNAGMYSRKEVEVEELAKLLGDLGAQECLDRSSSLRDQSS